MNKLDVIAITNGGGGVVTFNGHEICNFCNSKCGFSRHVTKNFMGPVKLFLTA